jgi:hypothetical protein
MDKANSVDYLQAISISAYKKKYGNDILEILFESPFVSGVLLGGSVSYKLNNEGADLDFFCLISNLNDFESALRTCFSKLDYIDVIIYQGYYPWTEKLYTCYYQERLNFSIDICLIDINHAESFFWEPEGKIIFDKYGKIETFRNNTMLVESYIKQPFLKPNPFSLAIIALKKIGKNLSRNHLWNALEQMNILRRYIMQITRLHVLNDTDFLGRVDRDIEDVFSQKLNEEFSDTIASYNVVDIAFKTIFLCNLLKTSLPNAKKTGEANLIAWMINHIDFEENKLVSYIK